METHVMIKTHNITGLKYLCKTTRPNPHAYKGSGKYWKRHLKKHGDSITTQVILRSRCKIELEDFCLEMSRVLDVVASDEWANLVPENGLDGGVLGTKLSDETRAKLSAANTGKSTSDETKAKMSAAQQNMSDETRAKMSASSTGKKHSAETKAKMSADRKGKSASAETKAKMSAARKGKSTSDETRAKLSAAHKGKPWSTARREAQNN